MTEIGIPISWLATDDRLLRLPDVEAMVGLKRSAIYARIAAGQFPAACALGGGAVRWRASEVQAWIKGLPVAQTQAEAA